MDLSHQLVKGLPHGPVPVALLYLLGALTLVFSMIVASRLAGGIDFRPITVVLPKGAALLAVVTAVNLLDCGLFLAGPIWFFGLMLLFGLNLRQTRTLTEVNWFSPLTW